MPTQITFTDDVGAIATASNVDGSIRWHMYERPFGAGTSVFVQREVNGVLEPEVRLLHEGERPDVFFDPVRSQWVITYILNENTWVLLVDEYTPPATQPPQTGTFISHLRHSGPSEPHVRTIDRVIAETFFGLNVQDVQQVPNVLAVGIGASNNPGTTLVVRWRATPSVDSNLNLYVAGFHIYRKGLGGAVERVNAALIPFEGFDPVVYEHEVPAVQGTYFVVQVNTNGLDPRLIEGRITGPRDTIRSDGTEIADVILSKMDRKLGESRFSEDLVIAIIDRTPVNVAKADTFPGHGPAKSVSETSPESLTVLVTFTVVQVETPINDTFPSHGPSQSFTAIVDIDNQGGVIIG